MLLTGNAVPQARQVRQIAAENLGALSAMSVRVGTLANDLIRNAQDAAPNMKEPYFTALKGVLASSGQRLSPPTLSAAGSAVQNLLASAGRFSNARQSYRSSLSSVSLDEIRSCCKHWRCQKRAVCLDLDADQECKTARRSLTVCILETQVSMPKLMESNHLLPEKPLVLQERTRHTSREPAAVLDNSAASARWRLSQT